MRIILILILFGISTCMASSASQVDISFSKVSGFQEDVNVHFLLDDSTATAVKPRAKKVKAVLLAIFLGHFGVHRIYLGSSPNVPVVYSLTLGGGFGLLPLLDIVAIISSKDLEQFSNNDKVFMWSKSK